MTLQAPVPPPGAEPESVDQGPKADLRNPASWLPTVKVTAGAFLIALRHRRGRHRAAATTT